MHHQTATLLVDSRSTLGEGLAWNAARQAWFWSDIEGARIWTHRPADGFTRTWRMPDRVGSFVFTQSGGVVLGLATQLALARLDEGSPAEEVVAIAPLVDVERDVPATRINDGRTDRAGAFVFGTYNERSDSALGSLYQYSRDRGLRRLDLPRVACANSICFSRDGSRMYYCDSPTRRIMTCEYDTSGAAVGEPRVFVELTGDAMPDGSVIDAEGGLWNAEWGSGRVRRYDAAGAVTHEIELAAPHATCPAFGGPELTDLAVTSSHMVLSVEERERLPMAGGLFHCRPANARGIQETLFVD